MRQDIAGPETESTMPMWEGLEGVVREKAQEFIQQILEEEVTELLGREKSERKAAVDAAPSDHRHLRLKRGGATWTCGPSLAYEPRRAQARKPASPSGTFSHARSGKFSRAANKAVTERTPM